jgi:hypothetical protein
MLVGPDDFKEVRENPPVLPTAEPHTMPTREDNDEWHARQVRYWAEQGVDYEHLRAWSTGEANEDAELFMGSDPELVAVSVVAVPGAALLAMMAMAYDTGFSMGWILRGRARERSEA